MRNEIAKGALRVKENIKSQRELEESVGRPLHEMNPDNYERFAFTCITCPEDVNAAIVMFYDHDVTRVQCYDCQNKNRQFMEDMRQKHKEGEETNYFSADTYSEMAI